jgi:hypothetical protein
MAGITSFKQTPKLSKANFKALKVNKKKVIGVIGGLMVLVMIVGLSRNSNRPNTTTAELSDGEEVTALAEAEVNKQYQFSAMNSEGEKIYDVQLLLTKAEKTKQVLVQGKPAKAKGDKAFLVLHMEVENSNTTEKYLRPVDLIRLVDDQNKKYAPDIHSDILLIQPISTKGSRVGFVVDQAETNFKFLVGELEGHKEEVLVILN